MPDVNVNLCPPRGQTTSAVFSRCEPCGHVWPVVYLPMAMETAARVMRASRCPACGSGQDRHFIADEDHVAAWRAGAHDKGLRR